MSGRMLKYLIATLLFLGNMAHSEANDNIRTVKEYYKAFNKKDYWKLGMLVSDRIVIVEMESKVVDSKDSFLSVVKWGEVLRSKNIIKSITQEGGKVVVIEKQKSDRIKFIYGKEVIARSSYTVESGQIVKIEVELLDFDRERLKDRNGPFMHWVKMNYPSKMQAMRKVDREGAVSFKEAMKLYRKRKPE